jgi:hypothetical protein
MTLLALSINVALTLMAAEFVLSESESEHLRTGTGGATVHSTWDVLPSLLTENAVPRASSSSDTSTVVNHTSVWMTLVHESNWSQPSRIGAFNSVSFGWEDALLSSSRINPMPYARQVQLPLLLPLLPDPVVDVPRNTVPEHENAWHAVARRVRNINAAHSAEATRTYAVNKWKLIIQTSPKHSEVGRLLQKQIWDLFDDSQLLQTLEDIFSTKSTPTLLKRANCMMKFIIWCNKKRLQVFPVSEQTVYTYLYDAAHVSPTGPSAFKEALNFSSALIGLDGAKEAASSPRVIGYCKRRYLQKSPLKQARVLSVAQVIHLESMLVSDRALEYELPDRVMAGHALYAMYARARWTDSLFPTQWVLDEDEHGGGFYQADTLISKTSTTAEKKTRFLPLTGPLNGISTNSWFQTWTDLRLEANLCPPDGKRPIMCSVKLDGSFSSNKLSTTDASCWLRDILKLGGFTAEQTDRVSSHSLKATLLSWCSKFGLDISVRQVLGYHTTAANTSAAHYSRDELAGPLRKLEEVLDAIRSGLFQPDQTRSGYMRPTPKAAVNPSTRTRDRTERGSLEPRKLTSDSSSSESSSESSESGEDSGVESVALQVERSKPADQSHAHKKRKLTTFGQLFLHVRWKTIHAKNDPASDKFKCGRFISSLYKPFFDDPMFQYHKCQDCFRSLEFPLQETAEVT